MYDLRCLPIPTVGWEENSLGTYKKYKGLLGAFNKSWKNLEIHIHLNFKPLESVLILNSTDRTVQVYLYMLSIYWSWSSKLILFSVKLFFAKIHLKILHQMCCLSMTTRNITLSINSVHSNFYSETDLFVIYFFTVSEPP